MSIVLMIIPGEKLKKAIEKIYLGENLIFEQQALLEKIS